LQQKIKAEIQKLTDEKREHLATVLQQESDRLTRLVTDLQAATSPVQLAVLESELIDAEYRVDNEVNILQRESETQDLLIQNAKILKEWVTEEIAILEKTEGEPARERALAAARLLRREETNLENISTRLVAAQTQREIETLEAEMRALEVRLYEALRALNFDPTGAPPVTTAAPPATTSAPPETTAAPPATTAAPPVTTGAP